MTTVALGPRPAGLRALTPDLLALRPRAVWREMRRQPIAVWALFVYLFFEYVRPQSIYSWLDFLPWAQLSLITAVSTAAATEIGKRRWTVLDTGLLIYTLIVLGSLVIAFDFGFALDGIDVYLTWLLVFFAISSTVNTPARVLLMLLGWFVWNFKMSFHAFRTWASIGFGFQDWGVAGAPGWFENSGEFGIQMCVVMPISLYFAFGMRRYVSRPTFLLILALPFTAVAGAIASSSRGALLGMAAIGFWMFLRSRYKARTAIGLAALGAIAILVVPAEQKDRFRTAGDDRTSTTRITYWKRGIDIAKAHPVLGVGYRNWLPYYRSQYGGQNGVELSHNIFIECVTELGFLGLAALLFLITGSFWLNAQTRALARRMPDHGDIFVQLGWGFDGALIGFMVSGFFVTVLYYPYLWVNLAMTVSLHLTVARSVRTSPRSLRALVPRTEAKEVARPVVAPVPSS